MSDEEIESVKKKMTQYEVENGTYLDRIINAELQYDAIIDDIFLSLGGFSFSEKADREIKDGAVKAVKNSWRENEFKYTIKNGKISFDILSAYKCSIWKEYRVTLNGDDYQAVLRALSYFDSNKKRTSIYDSWYGEFVTYDKKEKDGVFATHSVYGNKITSFKYFKNGKFEVTFNSHINALKFAKEFLEYVEQARKN